MCVHKKQMSTLKSMENFSGMFGSSLSNPTQTPKNVSNNFNESKIFYIKISKSSSTPSK